MSHRAFLLDENISPIIGDALAGTGHDIRLATVICPGATDAELVAVARAEDRIVISEDKDFGELAFVKGLRPPGLIRLALPGYLPAGKAERLLQVDLDRALGAILTVEPSRTRRRLLP